MYASWRDMLFVETLCSLYSLLFIHSSTFFLSGGVVTTKRTTNSRKKRNRSKRATHVGKNFIHLDYLLTQKDILKNNHTTECNRLNPWLALSVCVLSCYTKWGVKCQLSCCCLLLCNKLLLLHHLPDDDHDGLCIISSHLLLLLFSLLF